MIQHRSSLGRRALESSWKSSLINVQNPLSRKTRAATTWLLETVCADLLTASWDQYQLLYRAMMVDAAQNETLAKRAASCASREGNNPEAQVTLSPVATFLYQTTEFPQTFRFLAAVFISGVRVETSPIWY